MHCCCGCTQAPTSRNFYVASADTLTLFGNYSNGTEWSERAAALLVYGGAFWSGISSSIKVKTASAASDALKTALEQCDTAKTLTAATAGAFATCAWPKISKAVTSTSSTPSGAAGRRRMLAEAAQEQQQLALGAAPNERLSVQPTNVLAIPTNQTQAVQERRLQQAPPPVLTFINQPVVGVYQDPGSMQLSTRREGEALINMLVMCEACEGMHQYLRGTVALLLRLRTRQARLLFTWRPRTSRVGTGTPLDHA